MVKSALKVFLASLKQALGVPGQGINGGQNQDEVDPTRQERANDVIRIERQLEGLVPLPCKPHPLPREMLKGQKILISKSTSPKVKVVDNRPVSTR
ncbi:hypothetical protein CHS0354_012267 [Potamilus streckersoni]|uniref:Uncharacterized protein n=1 Tax=Potamilus streckersoni TaxID=2493646 RepID=A0AAE0SYS7_9BIVA|nr:hypothetical protein CHS0354_012267 [Potamilus streckersoni]